MTAAARVAWGAVTAYQRLIAPFLPPACRFAPTCSEYTKLALADHGLVRGLGLALWRLLHCHPWHPGGYDPPPSARRA